VTDAPFELCLITKDPELAGVAWRAGVERVFVDLETIGKAERQRGQGLFLSDATLDDLAGVRATFQRNGLMVRVNPLHDGTAAELDAVLSRGADIVMLPMARRTEEVASFVSLVAGRAITSLLLETRESLDAIERIVCLHGVHEIHVGLNDLRLSLGATNIFSAIVDGHIARVAAACADADIRFGFGGVTRPTGDHLPIPPDCIIAELVRHGARMALLGRSFKRSLAGPADLEGFKAGIEAIRSRARYWSNQTQDAFDVVRNRLSTAIANGRITGLAPRG
jgi:hypothetical protein